MYPLEADKLNLPIMHLTAKMSIVRPGPNSKVLVKNPLNICPK